MGVYKDFLSRFVRFTQQHQGDVRPEIRWAVVGSHALAAHARQAGIDPPRTPHDLDIIVFLPRIRDAEFRDWLANEWSECVSIWVYSGENLWGIHVRPHRDNQDEDHQIDLFPKTQIDEIGRAVDGEVLGERCKIVGKDDLLAYAEKWAEDTKWEKHIKHKQQAKYQANAEWIRANLIRTATP